MVDAAIQERFLDLLGEHALGPDLSEGNVSDLVAGGLDDLQFHLVALLAKQGADMVRLPERQL